MLTITTVLVYMTKKLLEAIKQAKNKQTNKLINKLINNYVSESQALLGNSRLDLSRETRIRISRIRSSSSMYVCISIVAALYRNKSEVRSGPHRSSFF